MSLAFDPYYAEGERECRAPAENRNGHGSMAARFAQEMVGDALPAGMPPARCAMPADVDYTTVATVRASG
jgi:hypothetical protein